jgi:hypothetical protein
MAASRLSCQGKGMPDKDDKAERLAAALRENLRRRKAQARSLAEQPQRVGNRQRDRDDPAD